MSSHLSRLSKLFWADLLDMPVSSDTDTTWSSCILLQGVLEQGLMAPWYWKSGSSLTSLQGQEPGRGVHVPRRQKWKKSQNTKRKKTKKNAAMIAGTGEVWVGILYISLFWPKERARQSGRGCCQRNTWTVTGLVLNEKFDILKICQQWFICQKGKSGNCLSCMWVCVYV